MAKESLQKKIERTRKPKVHLEYDVEIGDAIEKKSLPLVVAVLGEFTDKKAVDPKTGEPLRFSNAKRKFKKIDRDNFDDVLKEASPEISVRVPNRIGKAPGEADDGSMLNANLKFEGMKDFHPDQVVQQVPALKELMDKRAELMEIKRKLDGNDRLDDMLGQLANDPGQRDEFLRELGDSAPKTGGDSGKGGKS